MTRKRFSLFLITLIISLILIGQDSPPANSIYIEKNPSKATLAEHDVYSWMTWEKEPSTFPWQFTEKELVYVVEGKVKIRPEGSDQVYVLEKGDFASFAPGLRCYWEVTEPFKKHVTLEKDFLGKLYWTAAFKIQAIPRHIKKLVNI
jgi:uncharacterized protein